VFIDWDDDQDKFKSTGRKPSGEFEAGVRLALETSDHGSYPTIRPVENRDQKGTRQIPASRGPWNPSTKGWFSAGYGPMRRLSGSSSESMRYATEPGAVGRYVTLFREDAALSESEEWLKKNYSRSLEPRREEIGSLLDSVRELLGDGLLPYGMRINRLSVDHVYVCDARGIELPMRDISDGCRSMYATILDIIHGMYETYGYEGLFARNKDNQLYINRPGVVLIDEIEAHLHPKWQREIPTWLKSHFPLVQFLVATHSPLVAQAADANGIFVLPSLDDVSRQPRRLTRDEYDKIRWGRAEKTLLGSAFGLSSTRSNWANQQIETWKRLSAKKRAIGKLSKGEENELKRLKDKLNTVLDPVREIE
jgi:hypothetical protein